MKVASKVVTVTGGGNGIGQQVVLEALSRGARVAAVDIRRESLEETEGLADAGDGLATFVVDITDRTATAALPEQVVAVHGAVDGLINVAGIIQPFVKLNELEYETIERVINVDLYGTIHMVMLSSPICSSGRSPTSPTSPAWEAFFRCPARPSTGQARRR